MVSLSDNQVRILRLRGQRLTPQSPDPGTGVAQVVQDLCGIQAQEAPAAALSIRVRSAGLVASDVEHARVEERSIIRTWGPRGTLHLLATQDVDWLIPLLGPVFVAGDRRRRAELGLDEDLCMRAIRIIRDALANQGPLTRAEIVVQLATHSIHIQGQARPHLLYRAALEGVICLGPDRGAEPTYVLLNHWIDQRHRGHPLSDDAAYSELTRRYLNAYGPATPQDQAAWSGMPLSKTRAAWQSIADQLLEVDVAGAPAWMLKTYATWLDGSPTEELIVRLLPRFDTYLLGYQNRDLSVPSKYAKRINAGGGILHPTVLANGHVVGTWKSKRLKNSLEVTVEPFDQLATLVQGKLEAEVTDLARFLDVQVTGHVLPPQ